MRKLIFLALFLVSVSVQAKDVRLTIEGECVVQGSKGFGQSRVFKQFESESLCMQARAELLLQRQSEQPSVMTSDSCFSEYQRVLIRDASANVELDTRSHCRVTAGRWFDPYSGEWVEQPEDLAVDRIIPLAYARSAGAWDTQSWEAFSHDPDNLITVQRQANTGKGAKGPSQWLPDNRAFTCSYLGKWKKLATKHNIQLNLDDARFIMRSVAQSGCNPMQLVSNR